MESSFTYKANPRPVQDRAKYRNPGDPTLQTCNIAVDPRIAHGRTYEKRSIKTEQLEPIPSYPKKITP